MSTETDGAERHGSQKFEVGRSINMQPESVAFAYRSNLRYRVYAGGRGCSNGSNDGKRSPTSSDIFLDGAFQRRRIHTKFAIYPNFAQSLLAHTQHNTRFFNRG